MERAKSTKWMVTALAVLAIAVLALALIATPSAQAAQKKAYSGYKQSGKVYSAGYISMNTYDPRGVSKAKRSPYIWSLNNYDKSSIKKMKGVSYNKKKNTLTLKNAKYPKYTLNIVGMGTAFKIKLKGKKNAFAGINANSCSMYNSKGKSLNKEYPCSLNFTGKGTLTLNKNKYGSNAIYLGASGTKSKIAFAKGVKVKAYAYGTGHVIFLSTTTIKKNASAISIKGKASGLQRRTGKVSGSKEYKRSYNVCIYDKNAQSKTVYKDGSKYYIVESSYEDSGETPATYYNLRRVAPINGKYFASVYEAVIYDVIDTKFKTYTKVSGSKVVAPLTESMVVLNKGAYYGMESASGLYYFDSKTRDSYINKWDVFKKVATATGDYGSYIFVQKAKTVGNNKKLPKGYSGSIEFSYKGGYTHALANASLSIR